MLKLPKLTNLKNCTKAMLPAPETQLLFLKLFVILFLKLFMKEITKCSFSNEATWDI